ncbi:MAG: putative phosphoglycerate mutase [Paraglaciecola sp.]|jgi:probable phosphoglycerate mutase
MKYLIFSLCFMFMACSSPEKKAERAERNGELTVIYLVRHAEKETGKNPVLTEAGKQRAEDLAAFFKKKNVTEIFSTDYRRTQQTAAPTARQANRGVGSYRHKKLEEIAGQVRKNKGVILIVGHSNTTPELAKIFGGDPGEPIVEAWEYDRLYKLKLKKGKLLSSEILRYGAECKP